MKVKQVTTGNYSHLLVRPGDKRKFKEIADARGMTIVDLFKEICEMII